MGKTYWSLEQIPAQPEKTAVVTGANSGLGFETTKAFVSKKIKVIMACRDLEKGKKAQKRLCNAFPDARLSVMKIDLASLNAVRDFARNFQNEHGVLDILVNNAGVMMPPFQLTEDGFELQLAVNYLGHFLLTGLLLPNLEKAESSRVISLSSLAHRWGKLDLQDLQYKKHYNRKAAYGQSKLACLIFAYELQRRLTSHGKNIRSFAAHPGLSSTSLARHIKGISSILLPLIYPFSQQPKKGALPEIRAALDEKLHGGEYVGPSGWLETKGKPICVNSSARSMDLETSKKLWKKSETLTGISYL